MTNATFPHPREGGDVATYAGGAGPGRVRAVLLAWRTGYRDAEDPRLNQFSRRAPGDTGTNFTRPLARAYRAGFAARRDERLGAS